VCDPTTLISLDLFSLPRETLNPEERRGHLAESYDGDNGDTSVLIAYHLHRFQEFPHRSRGKSSASQENEREKVPEAGFFTGMEMTVDLDLTRWNLITLRTEPNGDEESHRFRSFLSPYLSIRTHIRQAKRSVISA